MTDRRIGVTFPLPDWRLRDHRAWVQRLPDLGYTDLWTGEANLTDAFVALASAAQWAPTMRLGTGIVPAFTRSPGLLAMSAASMADVTSGNFVLGVGASSPAVVERWGGTPWEQPFARTRDVTRFLRRAMTGDRVTETYETFGVDGFRLTPRPETPPRVLVAGLRPGMLRMAGRESDGAVLTWASPDDIRRMAPIVREGGPDKEIVAWVTVYPTTDAEAVRAHMRPLITSYFTVAAYADFHRWAGRGPRLEPMWAAWERNDRRGALAAVPDSVIDELVVHGSPEHCREQLEAYYEAGVDTLTLSVMTVDSDIANAVGQIAPPMSSPTWNFADLFDAIASDRPTSPAVDDGALQRTWQAHEQRADALARSFADAGVGRGAAVAVCLRNSSEFLECYYAAMKAAMVPVNVNYRYGPDELTYILDDCEAQVVVVGAEFLDAAAAIIDRLPAVKRWLVVDSDRPHAPPFVAYETAVADGAELPSWPWNRSGDDIVLIYTGGTTGMPKGVMWAHTELFEALIGSANRAMNLPPVECIDDVLDAITEPVPRGLAASPLMHSTGLLNQWMTMLGGGTAVIYRAQRLDAEQLLRVLSARRVTSAAIVGDAFGRPLLAALDAGVPGIDLSALTLIVSSGAMFSEEVKAGLLRHLPQASIYDAFGSSEGFGLGISVSTADTVLETASFRLGPQVRVIRDDGTWVEHGETAVGRVAVCGPLPVGYHRDPDRSARTWPVIDGVRYSIPGDYVAVQPDGSLMLLGRGSHCINTGGEKVFPEEVEEALKEHPDIVDAACVGRPDGRLGAKVCAVVVARPGVSLGVEDVVGQSKRKLASYKAPREVVVVEQIPRTALGKVDYPAVQRIVDVGLAVVDG